MAMFTQTCPLPGDTDNVLLAKIAQSICQGSGGGGVASVNGQSGIVLLDSDEVPEGGTNLYFTEGRVQTFSDGRYVLKSGDTMTGQLAIAMAEEDVTPLVISGYGVNNAGAATGLSLSGEWDTTGAPKALLVNILNTASGSASQLFDFQLNSTSVLNLRVDGRLSLIGRVTAQTTSAIGHRFFGLSAINTAVPTVLALGHNLSGGLFGADGVGATIDWFGPTTTTAETLMAQVITQFSTADHATRSTTQSFQGYTGGVFNTNLVLMNGQVLGNPGTAALPAFSNRNDPDTGMYFPAANQVGFSTDTTLRLTISTTAVTSTLPFLGPDGSAAAPGISFASEPDTGMYTVSGVLAFTQQGVLAAYFNTSLAFVENYGIQTTAITLGIQAAYNVVLGAEALGTLIQRDTFGPQRSRIYETTDAGGTTNFSRLTLETQTGNHLIRTEAGGTGTLRTLQVGTGPRVGTDLAGINAIFHGGQSTGTGAAGALLLQVSPAGGAGAGVNALVTRFEANNTGIGFFAVAPVVQQVSGANLTNNVTAGGTDDTIANYTDLTTYATDAAAIRDNIYQLARKLKQVNDALRLYGLLT